MIRLIAAASDIGIGEALGNMVVGLGVVFLALLFLCGVISLFKFLNKGDQKTAAPAKAPVKAAPAAAAPVKAKDEIDGAVVAAILAAVAQKCGPNARVVSIEKSK